MRGDGASDLGHFNGMGQAIAKVIGMAASKNLRLVFEAAEGARVDDTITIALEVVAIGMRRLREAASARIFDMHRVAGQHGESLTVSSE